MSLRLDEEGPEHQVYLVAAATYRRPAELKRLLDSLQRALPDEGVDVLIVDNDGSGSGRDVAENHRTVTKYLVEPKPGIAAARNRALDEFGSRYCAIIFIDDDEWVSENWFDELASFHQRSKADVVTGPVVTHMMERTPAWIAKGNLLQRPILSSGAPLSAAATNNTLLDRRAWVRAERPRFDPGFSTTGGSDTDFFWGLRLSGASIVYCAGATVHEDGPEERLNPRWLVRRFVRVGIVESRVRMKYGDRPYRSAALGLGKVPVTLVRCIGTLIRHRTLAREHVSSILLSLGRVLGILGYRSHEYSR